MPKNNNVNFIDSKSNTHPPLYCKICDVRMMFMLTGKLAQKYLCGMCGYTVDPNEFNESNKSEDEDDDDEHYSKHNDGLRSIDDYDDVERDNRYESMIVQSSNTDTSTQVSKAEERRPQMTRQRREQYQQQLNDDDWAYRDLKRDIEADGQRRIVELSDNFTSDNPRVNRIIRPR